MTSRLMITDRTKLMNKKVCFNDSQEFIDINKEKYLTFIKPGFYSWYFIPDKSFSVNQPLKSPLKEQVPLLGNRYETHIQER